MEIGHRLFTSTATDIGVDGLALNGTGANECHFNHEVIETAGLDAGQGAHLRSGLHLKKTDRIGPTEQVVDNLFLRQFAQVHPDTLVLLNEINGPMQRLKHAETQQVKLHESGGGAVVLIPLQYRSTRRPTPLHGTDLTDGSITDHHAGRVNTEMTRPVE